MKNIWMHSILPLLVIALLSGCGGGGGGSSTPPGQASTPAPAQPTVQQQSTDNKDGKNLSLPKSNSTDETKPNLTGKGGPHGQPKTGQGGGDVNQAGLDFTGAGSDYLRGFFAETMLQRSDSEKQADNELAYGIQDVRYQVEDGDVNVKIKFLNREEPVLLTGALESTRSASLTSDISKIDFQAKLTCLDRGTKHCYTAALSMKGKSGIGIVLLRHTMANVNYDSKVDRRANNDFLKLVNLFMNTQEHRRSSNSLKTVYVESFEVIGGASGVKVSILTNEYQLITAAGPLVACKVGDGQDLGEMNRDLDLDELVDLERGHTFKTSMQESISQIRMVGNDGSGNITIELTVPGNMKYPDHTLQVDVLRIAEPVLDVHQLENRLYLMND